MTEPSSPTPSLGLRLGVALVSAAVLGTQVLETRLLSVMLWHHLTYMVVTVTLLGFAAGGSLLAVRPRLAHLGGDPGVALSWCATLFGLTLLGSFAWLAHHPLDTLDLEQEPAKYFALFARYAYLVVPFGCAGLGVAIALAAHRSEVHRVYGWNLLGSGMGSVLLVVALRPLGGPGCLAMLAGLGALAGWLAPRGVAGGRARIARRVALLTTCGCMAGAAAPAVLLRWIPVTPARSKALSAFETVFDAEQAWYRMRDPSQPPRDPSLRHTVWDPVCRIDTRPQPQAPELVAKDRADPTRAPRSEVHVFQDGDAPTVIWSSGFADELDPSANQYTLAYHLLPPQPDVLVIGPGGGNEVATALREGARSVTAVDVNGALLELMQGAFAGYTGGLYERDRVTVVHAEGRSFLRRQVDAAGAPRQFDLLSMSGTDTYAALASGSYVFSESYLYTAEAFDDFFAHLAPRGVMQVLRFRFEPPRETLKLVVTAAQALQRAGVSDPRGCVLVIHLDDRQWQALDAALQGSAGSAATTIASLRQVTARFAAQPMRYGITLLRKEPFVAAEVQRIADAVAALNRSPQVTHALVYDAGTGVVEGSAATAYGRALQAIADGRLAQLCEDYPFRITPATDDRPFFFAFDSFGDLLRPRERGKVGYAALTGSEPIGQWVLLALLVQTLLATAALVLLPLLALPRRSAAGWRKVLAFFSCLGAGYFLVEIATVQRLVLYLGHPTYSLTVNLATFLIGSGLGSMVAGRLGGGRRAAKVAATAVVVLLLVQAIALGPFLRATLAAPFWQRVLWTWLWVGPLAFCMGVPFPCALRIVGERAAGWLPWAVGVNGAASVLASVVSVMAAMQWGFAVVLAIAAATYALAAAIVPRRVAVA